MPKTNHGMNPKKKYLATPFFPFDVFTFCPSTKIWYICFYFNRHHPPHSQRVIPRNTTLYGMRVRGQGGREREISNDKEIELSTGRSKLKMFQEAALSSTPIYTASNTRLRGESS